VLRSVLPLLVLLAATGTARAHLASDSYLRIEIQEARPFGGQWDIALRDLDAAIGLDLDQDGTITWGELRGRAKEIEAYAFERLTLTGESGACRPTATTLMVDYHAGSAYAVLPFVTECSSGTKVTLRYRLLFDLDPSHRGLLTIINGDETRSEVLTPEHAEIVLDRRPGSLIEQIVQFFTFGFDHILLGYDHLLFIAILLVMAAMHRLDGNRWIAVDSLGRVLIDTLKILTAFTLAHATVLTPAVLGMVNVPARLAEPAVAMTIMLAAFDNMWPILPRLRWQVAFLFGLIHGLSFASALGPMRLPALALALALASFNIGVEAGQITLALLLVPIVFVLRNDTAYRRFVVPGVSIGALLLAGVWLLDRVLGLDLMLLQPVNMASSGGVWR
jgi:hypothetical protein